MVLSRSPLTIEAYLTDARRFVAHLGERDVTDAERRDIEDYLVAARESGLATTTVARRYRSLLQLFRWLDDEGEIEGNPMAKMRPPRVVEVPPPIIRGDGRQAHRGVPW